MRSRNPETKELSLRAATPDDVDGIARLYVQLKRHHATLAPENIRYQVPDAEWYRLTARWLADPHIDILVGEAEGKIVGFVKMSYAEKPWGVACEIATLVVDDEWRGRGIGTRLLRQAEQTATQHGARGVRVDVLPQNTEGRSFYEREGYASFAVRYGKALGDN